MFTWHGRSYRLFKRSVSPLAPWQFHLERAGSRKKQSLRTNDKAAAITKAKLILAAADKGELEAMRAVVTRRSGLAYSPLAEVVKLFDRTPLDVSDVHRRNCVYSLKSVLLAARAGAIEEVSAGVLTEATARAYFEQKISAAKAEASQEDEARVKRSANSTFAQALCIFRPKLLSTYRRAGLRLPDLQPFIDVFAEERFSGIAPVYRPPSEEILQRTLHAWPYLLDRNCFLAIGLELACGLRKSEVCQTTWGMWARTNSGALLDGRGRVKNASGHFSVPPIDPFWTVLNRRIKRQDWRGRDEDLVLTGTSTEITDCTFRETSAWLRSLGWETQKTNHALRAFSGSLVAMKFGIYRAAAWLRHSSIKVTQQHYTHFLDSRVFRPEQVLVRWARPGPNLPAPPATGK